MAFNYAEQVFLVTGGAGGIGTALATAVAPLGAQLAIVDLRAEAATELIVSLPPGGNHRAYAADLTDQAQVATLLEQVGQDYGRIDVLINNMGMTSAARFGERSVESIFLELNVNLYAPLMLTRLAIPLLQKSADPRIISTVSLGGIFPLGETPIYTASKFGLRGAMLSIGLDLAQHGIKAGSVLPSATDTRMLRQEAIDGGNSLQFQDPRSPQRKWLPR